CKAADLGDQNGQLNCALLLKDGKGGEQDPTRAAELMELAGGQGNIAAKNLLAIMLLSGDGVPADKDRAVALFTETANQGNAMGLFQLANLAMSPEGEAEPDLIAAYSWANLAAVRGHAQAQKLRDDLETQMSVEDVAAAQAQSREWTNARLAEQNAADTTSN
ncbi:MAG: tetratricopeptide repeat protein, partial [Maritimibacter sp.]